MNTVSILHGLFNIGHFAEPDLMLFCGMPSSAVRRVSVQVPRSPRKAISRSLAFDVKLFLDSAGVGRKVVKFRGKDTVFAQGDPANHVLYIQEGGVKLTVINESGKEAVVAILGPGDFWAKGAWQASVCVWRRQPRLRLPPYSLSKKTR